MGARDQVKILGITAPKRVADAPDVPTLKEQGTNAIFVNWRGFSGGTKDMYDEVLKFGSYIVDNLSTYDQPIYNYILPNSQIRGGAMVVIGKKINSDKIKWFSSPDTKLSWSSK